MDAVLEAEPERVQGQLPFPSKIFLHDRVVSVCPNFVILGLRTLHVYA